MSLGGQDKGILRLAPVRETSIGMERVKVVPFCLVFVLFCFLGFFLRLFRVFWDTHYLYLSQMEYNNKPRVK